MSKTVEEKTDKNSEDIEDLRRRMEAVEDCEQYIAV